MDAQTFTKMPALFTTLRDSLTARLGLIATIVFCFALTPRPSIATSILLAVSALITAIASGHAGRLKTNIQTTLRAATPALVLFSLACLATIFSAHDTRWHLSEIPKVIALQLIVLIAFAVGRSVGTFDKERFLTWMFGVMAAIAVALTIEQNWFPLQSTFLDDDPFDRVNMATLNRSFLLAAFGLSFVLNAAWERRRFLIVIGTLLAMVGIAIPTHSESAQIVMVAGGAIALLPRSWTRYLLTISVIGAIGLMVLGPFIYEPILRTWEATPLGDFRPFTFLVRLQIYADFSVYVRENYFLGSGLNVSKILAADPSLFIRPYRPCVPRLFCAWHPHNGGVEVAVDLGFLGVAWMSFVLWKIRTLILSLVGWAQGGLIAVCVTFLMITFIADGLWQSWWWFAAAIVALLAGLIAGASPQGENEPEAANGRLPA